MAAFTREDILEVLDQRAESLLFPMLDTAALHIAGVRLHAFSSEQEWLIVFDTLGWSPANATFDGDLYSFGNALQGVEWVLSRPNPIVPVEGDLFADEEGFFNLDPQDFEVLVGESRRHFAPSVEEYRAAGVDLQDGQPTAAQVIRFLDHELGDALYASQQAILERCGRAGAGLTRHLYLKEYCHPDVADFGLPSETETYPMIADVLVAGDATLYDPVMEPNTHWSNWLNDC